MKLIRIINFFTKTEQESSHYNISIEDELKSLGKTNISDLVRFKMLTKRL